MLAASTVVIQKSALRPAQLSQVMLSGVMLTLP